jgi:RNA-directed DNA polymerase
MKQTSLRGIANKAASDKAHRFGNLFGLLSVEFLLWCWQFVNLRAASGVDRKDARSYQENLHENIEGLVAAVQEGWYRAKLVLRRYIPKLNGKLRPLGIPATADKLLQIGVTKILEAIYEADFLDCSYGYRPGVGALDAIRDLSAALQGGRYHFLVEADIRSFFDKIDHEKLNRTLGAAHRRQSLPAAHTQMAQSWHPGARWSGELPRTGLTARRERFSHPCQHLPPLCPGHLV